jgi:hypothetical protein
MAAPIVLLQFTIPPSTMTSTPGHERCLVGGQEKSDVGDFFGFAEPAE